MNDRRRRLQSGSTVPPLTFEQTLQFQNEPDKPLPEEINLELSTQKIHLSGIANRSTIENRLALIDEAESIWSIKLPDGAALGLPGRTGELLDRASVAVPEGLSTDPQKPSWSGISYQPRVAQPFHHGRMSTIGGRSIEQFYGIYNAPDARQVFYPQDYPWRCTGRIF